MGKFPLPCCFFWGGYIHIHISCISFINCIVHQTPCHRPRSLHLWDCTYPTKFPKSGSRGKHKLSWDIQTEHIWNKYWKTPNANYLPGYLVIVVPSPPLIAIILIRQISPQCLVFLPVLRPPAGLESRFQSESSGAKNPGRNQHVSPRKINGRKMNVLLGIRIFSGYASFRECNIKTYK